MIKIDNITSLAGTASVPISSIGGTYLVKVKRDYNPLDYLVSSLELDNLSKDARIFVAALNDIQRATLGYIVDNYDSIITGSPKVLEQHIHTIDNSIFGVDRPTLFGDRFVMTEFGKGIYDIFGYERYFRTKARKGIWLARQLNIKTCPYCNSQYTLIVKRNAPGFRAKFQFDHFFSKKRYPYLSISLYNLIPSCAPCNLSKGDEMTTLAEYYHPFHSNLALRSRFRANYAIELKKLSIGDIRNMNISIVFKSKYPVFDNLVNTHNILYDIESSYARHSDIIEDLLVRAVLYNSSFKNDIMEIKGLFNGDESLYKRYLIGNYGNLNETLNRPLAKFTQDIAKQFEII